MTAFHHLPVLLEEVLQALDPRPGKLYADVTVGGGGHSLAILNRAENIRLLGIDQDPAALAHAGETLSPFEKQVTLVSANFSQLSTVLASQKIPLITGGILADLGVSSHQLDTEDRGFSFRGDAPLDMRMNFKDDDALTAETVVNDYSEEALVRIFSEYGEERFSKTVAREIVQRRKQTPLKTTRQLADLIVGVYDRLPAARAAAEKKAKKKSEPKGEKSPKSHSVRTHPATQVFQALRIEVNDELGNLERFLDSLPALMAPGARIAIISFHSLEDRIVKKFMQRESTDCICPPRLPICQCGHRASLKTLSSKPILGTDEEIQANPRARSAKLRAAERL